MCGHVRVNILRNLLKVGIIILHNQIRLINSNLQMKYEQQCNQTTFQE